MPTAKPRARRLQFRPSLDRLEPIRLMAAGLRAPALVRTLAVTDLKPTPIGKDLLRTIAFAVRSSNRERIVLNKLTYDDATGVVAGRATASYKVSIFGTLTASVVIKSPLDSPKPRNVLVALDKFNSFLRSSDRLKVQRAVVNFLKANRQRILDAATPATA